MQFLTARKMTETNKFEKTELSKEILEEWYKEKETKTAPEKTKDLKSEETAPEPEFTFPIPSSIQKSFDKLKEDEEAKKSLIKGKIRRLLAVAEKKGLETSIKEARKENDPFLLDVYHDILAKDGAYKNLLKK